MLSSHEWKEKFLKSKKFSYAIRKFSEGSFHIQIFSLTGWNWATFGQPLNLIFQIFSIVAVRGPLLVVQGH